jgi:nicotinate-nucleotide--dimethylbenzimidazole phosphoribosyltransferase
MHNNHLIPDPQPLSKKAMDHARERQKCLTKPPGSLGRLEEISIQMAGITGTSQPSIHRKAVITMAGDHGVVEEGVSAYPAEVTPQMVINFLKGGAAINVLARQIGARMIVVDMGVAVDIPDHSRLLKSKIDYGTKNITRGPAMTSEQAWQCIQSGRSILSDQAHQGLDIIAAGDMGIGNTTPSAAIAAAITGRDPGEIVGRGTGVDDDGLERKISAVRRALEINQPDPDDGLDILASVGGFEIGGLTGVILEAAGRRIPVVIDGFISTAAAMLAVKLAPWARDYLFSAHLSRETGHRDMLDWLELNPLLQLDLRLGEGTGAVLAISLIDSACRILREMATFEEAGVSNKD